MVADHRLLSSSLAKTLSLDGEQQLQQVWLS
jgi:hypothetical protein